MTRKQMGVIYRAFKENRLPKTSKEDINHMYLLVDKFDDYDFRTYHHSSWLLVRGLEDAVSYILAGNYEAADDLTWGFDTVPVC